jgi:hypothetical protein
MKTLIVASAIAIASVTQAFALDELGKYQSKNRVVILFSGSGDQKLVKQVEVLKSQKATLRSGTLVMTAIGEEVRPVYGGATGVNAPEAETGSRHQGQYLPSRRDRQGRRRQVA